MRMRGNRGRRRFPILSPQAPLPASRVGLSPSVPRLAAGAALCCSSGALSPEPSRPKSSAGGPAELQRSGGLTLAGHASSQEDTRADQVGQTVCACPHQSYVPVPISPRRSAVAPALCRRSLPAQNLPPEDRRNYSVPAARRSQVTRALRRQYVPVPNGPHRPHVPVPTGPPPAPGPTCPSPRGSRHEVAVDSIPDCSVVGASACPQSKAGDRQRGIGSWHPPSICLSAKCGLK